jgi:threonine dehydrogenase-like Zn-dependent dehydrogenase
MKAVQLMGPEDVRVNEVSDPTILLPTDAIVKVSHTAICGADLLPYHGYTPGFEFGTILGHEFVGTVTEVGNAVTGISLGQRVVNTSMTSDGTCGHCRANRATQCDDRALFGYSGVYPKLDGGQAEFVRIPNASRTLWGVPDDVSTEDAIFVADILPTGFAAVQRGKVSNGDLVVVLGCGPVGLMSIIASVGVARRVIAVDGVADRRKLAETLGAVAVEPGEATTKLVNQSSNGVGADVVIEASGSVPAMQSAFGLARPQGVVSVVGAHFEPDFPLNNGVMFEKELTLIFSVGNPTKDRERMFAAIQAGKFSPSKVLTHLIPIEDAPTAYAAFDKKEMTKVVLVIGT